MRLYVPLIVLSLSATTSTELSRLQPAFSPAPKTYNYAPCAIRTNDGKRLHMWYCANRTPGDVTDYLCYREAVQSAAGWKWGPETVALEHGTPRTAWDSRHVCDPEVIGGQFRYQHKVWRFAMLYLGCDAEHSTHNQIGVAFANSLRGPWRRYPDPIVRYTDAADAGVVGEHYAWPVYRFWGVGQPAAVSLDRRGKVLLFFSRGEGVFGEEMAELDMSDMDRGPILTQRVRVPTEGLRRKDGTPLGALVNIGVALDEARDQLFMVREELPPSDGRLPDFIADYVQICATSWSALRKGAGSWKVLGEVDAQRTGWPRNHNATIVKDAWGRVQSGNELTLAISLAEAYDALPPEFGWLWTYRVALLRFPASRGPVQAKAP